MKNRIELKKTYCLGLIMAIAVMAMMLRPDEARAYYYGPMGNDIVLVSWQPVNPLSPNSPVVLNVHNLSKGVFSCSVWRGVLSGPTGIATSHAAAPPWFLKYLAAGTHPTPPPRIAAIIRPWAASHCPYF